MEGIHSIIQKEYEKRQRNSRVDLERRREEIYARIPVISQIDESIQRIGIKSNKLILTGNLNEAKSVVDELEAEVTRLKKARIKELMDHGYPADYLEMKYRCQKCKDTGFVETGKGTGKCACYRQQLIQLTYEKSNINLSFNENFEHFDESFYDTLVDKNRFGTDFSPRENILRIKAACQVFVENFDSPEEKNLFFSGPTGVGKTFMSNCIAAELIQRGRTVLYQTAPVLFNTISEYKTRLNKDDEYEDRSYKNIFEVELLIIDDLGTEPQSFSRYAELLTILNTRQMNDLSRPCKTIISTNIGIKKLEDYYTERVTSRIIGNFNKLMFTGDDIRLKKLVKN